MSGQNTMVKRMITNYADEVLAVILGFVAAHTGYHALFLNTQDSITRVIYSADPAVMDMIKFVFTTLCGFIGTIAGLYIKYKIEELKYKRGNKK